MGTTKPLRIVKPTPPPLETSVTERRIAYLEDQERKISATLSDTRTRVAEVSPFWIYGKVGSKPLMDVSRLKVVAPADSIVMLLFPMEKKQGACHMRARSVEPHTGQLSDDDVVVYDNGDRLIEKFALDPVSLHHK